MIYDTFWAIMIDFASIVVPILGLYIGLDMVGHVVLGTK